MGRVEGACAGYKFLSNLSHTYISYRIHSVAGTASIRKNHSHRHQHWHRSIASHRQQALSQRPIVCRTGPWTYIYTRKRIWPELTI